MKAKIISYFLPVVMGLSLSIITLIGLVSVTLGSCDTEHCTDKDYPMWCSSAETCCPSDMPYNDGHGSCWGTLESCRSTGHACEHCWED